MKAAKREGKLGVDVERGGSETTEREGKLGGEEELKAELGLTAAALRDELGDRVAGNAACEEAVEDRAADGALLGDRRSSE